MFIHRALLTLDNGKADKPLLHDGEDSRAGWGESSSHALSDFRGVLNHADRVTTAHPGRPEDATASKRMHGFEHKEQEQISRQKAAEILVDFAYVLTTGGPLNLEGDERVTVADEVALKRESKSTEDGIELVLELSWSTATTPSLHRPEAPRAE